MAASKLLLASALLVGILLPVVQPSAMPQKESMVKPTEGPDVAANPPDVDEDKVGEDKDAEGDGKEAGLDDEDANTPEDKDDQGEMDEDAAEDEDGETKESKDDLGDGAEMGSSLLAEDSEDAEHAEDEHVPLNETEVRSLYLALDSNKDAYVSREEAFEFDKVSKKRAALSECSSYLEAYDTSADGTLSLEEFLAQYIAEDSAVNDTQYINFREQKKAEFHAADVNGNDKLEKQEIAAVVDPQVEPAMVTLMAKAEMKHKDVNGDAKLDFKEFSKGFGPGVTYGFDTDSLNVESTLLEEETAHVDDLFKQVDRNKDNFVDLSELEKSVAGVPASEEFIDQLFSLVDSDKDGRVSVVELVEASMEIEESDHQSDFHLWHEHHNEF